MNDINYVIEGMIRTTIKDVAQDGSYNLNNKIDRLLTIEKYSTLFSDFYLLTVYEYFKLNFSGKEIQDVFD